MLARPSPYALASDALREAGYHPMPVMPGEKFPGRYSGGEWKPLPAWQKWCDELPPEFTHERWLDWPAAGVCIAHGGVVGVDVDTDDPKIAAAVKAALPASPCARRGSKGWMAYYRAPANAEALGARVRWYRKDSDSKVPVVELLLRGTQSVIPPTIHPDTGAPYSWMPGADPLEDVPMDELPELPADAVGEWDDGRDVLRHIGTLDAALLREGLTRKAPRAAGTKIAMSAPSGHDLEKPFGRSLNDRAMEPASLDRWFPALGLPKTRQRGAGAWEAVASWRASGSGRPMSERNPNLKAVPSGIRDFGEDRSYTPADLVCAARDCSFGAAAEWLEEFVRPEEGGAGTIEPQPRPAAPQEEAAPVVAEPEAPEPGPDPAPDLSSFSAPPVYHSQRPSREAVRTRVPTDAEFEALVPRDPQPFPIQNAALDCGGLLGEVASHLGAASVMWSEAGGLAAALPLLGVVMGRVYATPSNLRTNVYTVALGASGSGKTSLVNPAKELMLSAGVMDLMGQDRIASGTGLIRMLTSGPRRVCYLDEFGHMLQQIGAYGAGTHAKQILTEFTALYSAAGSVYTGTAYATREPEPIDSPHLCLFGQATPDQFWRAFGSSSLEDGSVARYLVMPLGETGVQEPDARFAQEAADGIGTVVDAMRSRVTGNLGAAGVVVAPLDDAAEARRARLRATMEACGRYADENGIRGAGPILRRVTENALKIALISAVGRNPSAPRIEAQDFDVGHALARWSACEMVSNIASRIADNQHERDVNDVERFIREAGERGRRQSEISRAHRRIKAKDLREILEALEKEGSVACAVMPTQGGGPSSRTYFGA